MHCYDIQEFHRRIRLIAEESKRKLEEKKRKEQERKKRVEQERKNATKITKKIKLAMSFCSMH